MENPERVNDTQTKFGDWGNRQVPFQYYNEIQKERFRFVQFTVVKIDCNYSNGYQNRSRQN